MYKLFILIKLNFKIVKDNENFLKKIFVNLYLNRQYRNLIVELDFDERGRKMISKRHQTI